MPHINSNRRKPATAVLLLLIATLALAACGGSSKSPSPSGTASTSTAGASVGSGGGRFAALRECLQKNGITLPNRAPGQQRGLGAGGFLGAAGGRRLPSGVTRGQLEAALKKCGGFPGAGVGGVRARFDTPAFRQALTKYAACLRQNGVNVPAPNTSGSGPVFNTRGLNTASPRFKAARAKCRNVLAGVFRGRS